MVIEVETARELFFSWSGSGVRRQICSHPGACLSNTGIAAVATHCAIHAGHRTKAANRNRCIAFPHIYSSLYPTFTHLMRQLNCHSPSIHWIHHILSLACRL